MASVSIDAAVFHDRLGRIHQHWAKNKEAAWGNADALCIPIPKFGDDDDGNYAKSTVGP